MFFCNPISAFSTYVLFNRSGQYFFDLNHLIFVRGFQMPAQLISSVEVSPAELTLMQALEIVRPSMFGQI